MAEFTGPNYRTIQHNGEYGNLSVAVLSYEYAAEAAASVVKFGVLPGGITITRVFMKSADLGSAQTYDLGYRFLNDADGTDDTDGFLDGVDTGTAAAENTFNGPLSIAEGGGVEVVGTNIGDAATGLVEVLVEYVYNGNG